MLNVLATSTHQIDWDPFINRTIIKVDQAHYEYSDRKQEQ